MNIVTISDQPSIPPILVFQIVSEIGNEQIDGKLNNVFCLFKFIVCYYNDFIMVIVTKYNFYYFDTIIIMLYMLRR